MLLKEQKNPLSVVADRLADEAQVICFDEFFVIDITDAMILAELLRCLLARGVVFVTTSNIEPAGLYRDGLQRARFLPAIAQIEENMDVINVDGGVDYRLRALESITLFHVGESAKVKLELETSFSDLAPSKDGIEERGVIDVDSREIPFVKRVDDVIWFEFGMLCDGPRSQNDYIELAREYHSVILEGVPRFTAEKDDQARRFIYMVDEFYDRQVKLVISAESSPDQLYIDGRLAFEFQRTISRLQEMQSREYLSLPHRG